MRVPTTTGHAPAPASTTRTQTRTTLAPARRVTTLARLLAGAARRTTVVEPEIIGLAPLVRPGDVCLDVGAKHGLYTAVLAAACGPTGRVVAFEPLPGPRRVLATLRVLTGATTVTVVPAAVSDTEGTDTLALPMRRGLPVPGRAYLTRGALGPGSNAEFRHHHPVRTDVVTIDAWAERAGPPRVDVIKVDVEGAEPAVIAGARATLERWHPTLLLELEARHLARYAPGGDRAAADLLAHLAELGYRAWTRDGAVWEPTAEVRGDRRNHLFVARPEVTAAISGAQDASPS
jgi:FkbM family methyltransferase